MEPSEKQHLMNTFWSLAAANDEKRVSGANTLLKILQNKQSLHDNEETLCDDVIYSLQRLVKGLASSRQGARQGYATALSELLTLLPIISLKEVFSLIKKHLHSNSSKQEEREHMFGQVFAYIAVVQSGRLQAEDGKYTVNVLTKLKGFSEKKSYLQDLCTQASMDLINMSSKETFSEHIWPSIKSDLSCGWEGCSPHILQTLLTCHRCFPDVVKSKFLKTHWGHKDILHPDNLNHVVKIFTESTIISHPNVNSVCDEVLKLVLQDQEKVTVFCQQVVDSGLLHARQECRYLALQLVERLLRECSAEEVDNVLSPAVVKILINSLANKQHFLHEASKKFSATLPLVVKEIQDGATQLEILKCLISKSGNIHFDQITKTRSVHNLINNLNLKGVKLYVKFLKNLFINGPTQDSFEKVPDLDSTRRWVCHEMLSLIRSPGIPKQEQWVLDVTQFLFVHAYFNIESNDTSIPQCKHLLAHKIGKELQELLASLFQSCLTSLSNMPASQVLVEENEPGQNQRTLGMTSGGDLWVKLIVQYAQQLVTSPHVTFRIEFTSEMKSAWEKMLSSVADVESKMESKRNITAGSAFQLLFLHVGLQIFMEPSNAVDLVEELSNCYKKAFTKRRSVAKQVDEPEWVEVVVDILIGLLSKSSHLLRAVVDNTFKMICSHMTKKALSLLVDVLDPSKNKEEESNVELVNDSEEEDIDEDKENSPSNGNINEEDEIEEDGSKHDDESDEDDDEDDDEEDDEEDEDDIEMVDDEFRAQIRDALGDAAVQPSDEEDEQEDEEDDDMDDETMMRFDSVLAAAFKEKLQKKKSKMEAVTLVLHFKLRVLDLVTIFIKQQPENILVADLLLPLVYMIQTASSDKDQDLLKDKAANIYKTKLCRPKKYPKVSGDEKEELHKCLEDMMKALRKASSVFIVSLISSGCLFLVRILTSSIDPSPLKTRRQRKDATQEKNAENDSSDKERISALYNKSLLDFMTYRATCLHPVLFTDLIERFPNLGWYLAPQLIQYTTENIQIYRKKQACLMLTNLISKRPYLGNEDPKKICKQLSSMISKVVANTLDSESTFRPKFILQFLMLMKEFAALKQSLNDKEGFDVIRNLLQKLKDKTEIKRSGELSSAIGAALKGVNNRSSSKRKRRKTKHRKRRSETEKV
ncbi:myb-binding protein 1A-like protein [Antedon mediterranea]|uniref:myb-binding protein 1A-like protein n=1 Tax=Antedon mediterranea TaxID=105859 RepID=UPI003AF6954D